MLNKIFKLSVLVLALSAMSFQSVHAFSFPAYSSAESEEQPLYPPFSLGGSVIVFDTSPIDKDNLSPLTFSFHRDSTNPNTGKLCLSGKVNSTIYEGKEKGTGTYELLGSDNSNTGICYTNVTRSCSPIAGANVGSGTAEKCIYTSPALTDTGVDVTTLLDGRFKIDTSLPTDGPYADCATNPTKNICDFRVGFGFNNPIPANFFPASTTRNDEAVNANVPLYSSEICIEFDPSALGLDSESDAIKSKFTNSFRVCEALAIKTNWCSDLQNGTDGPSCETTNAEGQLTTGGMNSVLGSTLDVYNTLKSCVSTVADLKALPGCPTAVAAVSCGDGLGYITFPDSFSPTTCQTDGSAANIFEYSSAQGGGTSVVNLKAIGAFYDSPGYIGDNTLPAISPLSTAVVSTPDNQPNEWDFSTTRFSRVAYIHARNNDDTVTGSLGDDTILGGSGADTIHGNDGNDVLQGGDNVDNLFGDNGDDLILGYECNGINASCISVLNKGSDDDILNGGNGDDCLDGGRGYDNLTGGAGKDAFVLYGVTNGDTFTDFNVTDDTVVDLTGNSTPVTAIWDTDRYGVSTCFIKTGGGSNGATLEGISSQAECDNVAITTTLPTQCSRHSGAL